MERAVKGTYPSSRLLSDRTLNAQFGDDDHTFPRAGFRSDQDCTVTLANIEKHNLERSLRNRIGLWDEEGPRIRLGRPDYAESFVGPRHRP